MDTTQITARRRPGRSDLSVSCRSGPAHDMPKVRHLEAAFLGYRRSAPVTVGTLSLKR